MLYLGFHDGYQWSNNAGSVSVTLRWFFDGSGSASESPSEYYTVPASACLFFAYAPSGVNGPHGEEPIDGYRPVGVVVPDGATQVQITAEGNWTYNHGDGDDWGGPGGIKIPTATWGEYMDGQYHSQNLKTITVLSGTLTGMWGVDCPEGSGSN